MKKIKKHKFFRWGLSYPFSTMDPIILYKRLKDEFGDLNWWPVDHSYHKYNGSDKEFEIIIGAILTQNTAWSNVEKALDELKKKKVLSITSICNLDDVTLRKLIKSSGFFNQKAVRIKNISCYLRDNYSSNLDLFFNQDLIVLREELLSLNGIGPETADSILLYAGNKPIFVVDAYTKRICKRLGLTDDLTYTSIQRYFQDFLSKVFSDDSLVKAYNELHALIVIFAKDYCRKKPFCKSCPLNDVCSYAEILAE